MIDKSKIITTITEVVYKDRRYLNERSILSFQNNMGLYKKAVINLDVYDPSALGETKDMFAKYFDCEFIISYDPHFTKALNNLWSHPIARQAETLFHFETDWELLSPPNERLMLVMLNNRDYVDSINLRAYDHLSGLTCLSPGWIKSGRIMHWLPFKEDINPEFQLHFDIKSRGCHRPNYIIIKDIGRAYMNDKDMQRTQQKYFTKWVRKGEQWGNNQNNQEQSPNSNTKI